MPQDEGVERKLVVKRGRFEVKIRSMIFKVFQILQKPAIKPFPKKRSNGKTLKKPKKSAILGLNRRQTLVKSVIA